MDYLLNDSRLAPQGLLIRLLLLPGSVNRVDRSLRWIRNHLGPETAISIMAPCYPIQRAAASFLELNRPITQPEYDDIPDIVEILGLTSASFRGHAPIPE